MTRWSDAAVTNRPLAGPPVESSDDGSGQPGSGMTAKMASGESDQVWRKRVDWRNRSALASVVVTAWLTPSRASLVAASSGSTRVMLSASYIGAAAVLDSESKALRTLRSDAQANQNGGIG